MARAVQLHRACWLGVVVSFAFAPSTTPAEERTPVPVSGGDIPVLVTGAPLAPEPEQVRQLDHRFWLLGAQATLVGMQVPGLRSPYRDPNVSFGDATATHGWSLVATLLGGVNLWKGATLVGMPEYANGHGAPNVSGVAGYPDANIIRVSKIGTEPYFARAFFHQDIALGAAEPTEIENPESRFMPTGPLALRLDRSASRLEITAGKFATNDFFDSVSISSDPRHRFMNWSLMTNGAWDFAADTRGYTWGAVVSLEQPRWALRAGVALMPTTANGPIYDGDVRHARSEMVEGEYRYRLAGNPGAVKLLGYFNHARMGSYADALTAAAGTGAPPTLDGTRQAGALKYGAGLLVDQKLGDLGLFLRGSWNDGNTETFAFTEIDRAVSCGLEIPGKLWGRSDDRVGLAFAADGLSDSHAAYLAAGGKAFQLGDGALRYAWELVGEGYYSLHVTRSVELSADLQGLVNPGMNADRGPALGVCGRIHIHL